MHIKHLLIFSLILLICNFESIAQNVEIISNEFIFNEPPFKQCHASSLVELSDGKIMAVWFGGTHEGNPDVTIWGSLRDKNGWSKPVKLADWHAGWFSSLCTIQTEWLHFQCDEWRGNETRVRF